MSRYGRIQYPVEFVETEWFGDVLAKLSFVPIQVEVDPSFDMVIADGYSRHFAERKQGEKIPEYIIEFTVPEPGEFPDFGGIVPVVGEGALMPWEINRA